MSDRLDEIEARANAAGPGVWRACEEFVGAHFDEGGAATVCECSKYSLAMMPFAVRNAEFIAHAREDVPYLVAEVRRLRAENDAWNAQNHSLVLQLAQQERDAEARERRAFEAGAERCAEANCSLGWYTPGAFDDWKREAKGDE